VFLNYRRGGARAGSKDSKILDLAKFWTVSGGDEFAEETEMNSAEETLGVSAISLAAFVFFVSDLETMTGEG
jgi:hypothetical protein